jgi:hypothetical protein
VGNLFIYSPSSFENHHLWLSCQLLLQNELESLMEEANNSRAAVPGYHPCFPPGFHMALECGNHCSSSEDSVFYYFNI